MRVFSFILVLFLVSTNISIGQTTDSISSKKAFGGNQYYLGDKMLTINDLGSTLNKNETAFKEFKSAKTLIGFGSVFSYIGGFLIGWPIGTMIGGGEPVWELAGIGAGFVAVSIPFAIGANKKLDKAVSIYNNGSRTSSIRNNTELRLSMTNNGLGFVYKF